MSYAYNTVVSRAPKELPRTQKYTTIRILTSDYERLRMYAAIRNMPLSRVTNEVLNIACIPYVEDLNRQLAEIYVRKHPRNPFDMLDEEEEKPSRRTV